MVHPLETVPIDEDYVSFILYRGEGFTVHENKDNELNTSWYTVALTAPVTPGRIRNAMAWFDGTAVVVIESEFDGADMFIDLVAS